MAYHYKLARKFYDEVAALCRPDRYNLVLHKHLGDVFYAIGAKEEFEAAYKSKLRFIIRPQHEFLMGMYGITDYGIYDLDALVKKNKDFKNDYFQGRAPDHVAADRLENEMFQALFQCVPVRGMPFVCESLINNFYTYPLFWSRRWAANMGVDENFQFAIPKYGPELSQAAKKALAKIAPVGKIVLFAPDAASAPEFAADFWNIIAGQVHAHGYKIVVNSKKCKIRHGVSAMDLGLSLSDVAALGLVCANVFALRSGLCDVLAGAGKKLYAFYPAQLHRELNSLNKCFDPMPDANEIAVWRWKIDPVVWEGEDLARPLQKYINSLRRSFVSEKIKSAPVLFSRRRRGGHRFWYRLMRDLAGVSKIYAENNTEIPNNARAYSCRFAPLGLPIYRRDFRQEQRAWTVRHYFLGGLIRFAVGSRVRKLSVLGVQLYNNGKILFWRIGRKRAAKKWLAHLNSRIDRKYDDVYIIWYNIGESYVELMRLSDRIKRNGSKRPLLVIPDEKYSGFYKMFGHKIDMQLIPMIQSEIGDAFFDQTTKEIDGRRFFCSARNLMQNMRAMLLQKPDANFYDYICAGHGLKKNGRIARPVPSDHAVKRVGAIAKKIGLGKKFAILMPDAFSLERTNDEFWETIAAGLRGKGYDIFINSYDGSRMNMTKTARMTIEAMMVLAQKSSGIITLGSGLAVFLTAAGVKMDMIYTAFRDRGLKYDAATVMKTYSVFHLPGVSRELVREYNADETDARNLASAILQRY